MNAFLNVSNSQPFNNFEGSPSIEELCSILHVNTHGNTLLFFGHTIDYMMWLFNESLLLKWPKDFITKKLTNSNPKTL